MIDFSKIRTLRDMVQTATDLNEPWNYFFAPPAGEPGPVLSVPPTRKTVN